MFLTSGVGLLTAVVCTAVAQPAAPMPVLETVAVPSPPGTVFVPAGGTAQILQITPSATQTRAVTGVKSIHGLAVDPNGDVFYTDLEEDHVVKVTPSGVRTTVTSDMGFSAKLAVDAAGNVYVADGEIEKVTPSGHLEPADPINIDLGHALRGVAVDATGDVYTTGLNTLIELVPRSPEIYTGTIVNTDVAVATAVAVDAAGNAYIADDQKNRVVKVTPAGEETTVASGLQDVSDIAVGTDDDVYVVDRIAGQVIEIGPGGVRTTVASGLTYPMALAVTPAAVDPPCNATVGGDTPHGLRVRPEPAAPSPRMLSSKATSSSSRAASSMCTTPRSRATFSSARARR